MTRKKLCLFRPFIQTTSWLYPIIEPVQRNHKCSQMLASHTFIRKSVKWTTKVAFHFIKEAISTLLFCFVLFRSHNKRSLFKTSQIDLCNSLITEVITDIQEDWNNIFWSQLLQLRRRIIQQENVSFAPNTKQEKSVVIVMINLTFPYIGASKTITC